jgi:hypothetical protein
MAIDLDDAGRFQAARERVAEAAEEMRKGIEEMLLLSEGIERLDRTHDEMAELVGAVMQVKDLLAGPAKEPGQPKSPGLKERMESAALNWLLENPEGVRRIRVGEIDYFGTLEKTTRCLDVGHTGATLAHIRLENSLLEVVVDHGSEESQDRFWYAVASLFTEVVSANGLKEGASSKLIEGEAESTLRARAAVDPSAVALLDGETPGQALERAVLTAREAAYADHWEETWPGKLQGAEPGKKLGVANQRFHARQGGGTAAYFKDLERRRMAAGDER